MKTCTKCKKTKDFTGFNKRKASTDGLQRVCKECTSVYDKGWREKNPERAAAIKKKWKEENRERVAATNRKWCEENRERAAATNRKWCEENRERSKAINCVDNALRRTSLPSEVLFGGHTRLEAYDFTMPFVEERIRLEEETGRPHHIDHIKPLCEGGLHIPENLQVLCAKENLTKGPIWFEEELTDEEIEALDAETLSFNPIS